jgi:argininosuccinate lyase
MKLWSGRLSGSVNEAVAALNDSLPFDQRMAKQDVRGSLAWARSLAKAGVLAPAEADEIVRGLHAVAGEFERGEFVFVESDEDIHTAVERRLTEIIGPLAGKLHTGRSRNDQVATDFRLWMMEAVEQADVQLRGLQSSLIARSEQDMGVILPGYTHTQRAQPILLSHWWLSHLWALDRDRQRLAALGQRTAVSPLGCGALAGTAFPIDREVLARELGFAAASPNSLDAVSDRDFAAEFLFCAALIGLHLSRMAEALILYSTAEFAFVELDDAYSTGSSLMPQKKNPDPLELIRGKSAKFIGLLTGLLAMLKALSSAYDKDLQEDKPPVFEAADTLGLVLPVMSGVLSTLTVKADRMRAAIDPAMLATDLADYLVYKGVPFREAHHAAGHAVKRAKELGVILIELPLGEWQAIHPAFGDDLYQVFDPERAIARRSAFGGTAPQAVRKQLDLAKQVIGNPKSEIMRGEQ